MTAAEYIYLAVGTGALGTVLTLAVLFVCQHHGIDVSRNLWVLAIPIGLSLLLNILLIELYSKFKRK